MYVFPLHSSVENLFKTCCLLTTILILLFFSRTIVMPELVQQDQPHSHCSYKAEASPGF